MKRALIILFIIIITAACSQTASPSPVDESTSGGWRCLRDEALGRELCITIRAGKETVTAGETLPLTITITSARDEPDLRILMTTYPPSFIERVQFPGQINESKIQFEQVFGLNIKAQQTLTLNGAASFTGELGVIDISVDLILPSGEPLAGDHFRVHFKEIDNGQVYYSGTEIPPLRTPLLDPSIDLDTVSTVTPRP